MDDLQKLMAGIETFLAEREDQATELDAWECDHLVSAIVRVRTLEEAVTGLEEMEMAALPAYRRPLEQVAFLPPGMTPLSLVDARRHFERLKRRPVS